MRIPDEKIEDVRNATDVVDLISAYVKLKKRGKNYIGLCPFHTEKTPSFTVSAEKQMYHCFGCGKGGNVFTFVMEMEKVSFVEAVRSLADRAGIVLPTDTQTPTEEESEAERLYAATRMAGLLFHEQLRSAEGQAALDYFHGRGFTDDTIRIFGLGYSLNSWDAFVNRARAENIAPDLLVKAGLARTREDGSLYDYFRGRAMFPIVSPTSRVLGFGARKMREDDPIAGKYINSPESPIYNKSRVLYGLSHSRDAIRHEDAVIMVEGYADLITLFQAGVQHVVASSGTALTQDQLVLLGRYTKNLILVYDADSAGSSAMVRGIDLALEQGLDVQVVELPQDEDPDSFVRVHGGKEFLSLVASSTSFIEFKARQFVKAGYFTSPERTTRAIRSIVESIAKIGDELKRNLFIKDVAQKFNVYESVLHREMEQILSRGRTENRIRTERAVPRLTEPTVSTTAEPQPAGPIPPEERDLLKLFLDGDRTIISHILETITLEDFSDLRARTLIRMVLDILDVRGTVDANAVVSQLTDEELKSIVTDVSLSRYELSKGWTAMEKEIDEPEPIQIARDALVVFRRKAIRRAMERNQQTLRQVTQQGGDTRPILERQQELVQMLKSLETSGARSKPSAQNRAS